MAEEGEPFSVRTLVHIPVPVFVTKRRGVI